MIGWTFSPESQVARGLRSGGDFLQLAAQLQKRQQFLQNQAEYNLNAQDGVGIKSQEDCRGGRTSQNPPPESHQLLLARVPDQSEKRPGACSNKLMLQ